MMKWLVAICSVLFSTLSYAEAANAQSGAALLNSVMLPAGIFLFIYLMFIRPQNKRAKEQQAMIKNLSKDDEIITTGGVLGKVTRVTDQYLVLAIAEGIEVTVQKQAVSLCLPKGTIKSI